MLLSLRLGLIGVWLSGLADCQPIAAPFARTSRVYWVLVKGPLRAFILSYHHGDL